MTSIRTIISTGPGRLHLFEAAISLKKIGMEVSIITGWIPGRLFSDKMLNFMGKFVGRAGNLAHGLRKRTPGELSKYEIKSCGASEFFTRGMMKLSSYHFIPYANSAVLGWKFFGLQSKKFIRNADIFHVRSGAGCAGAIEKAREQGMKIIVDHSIAHPKEMERQMNKIFKRTQFENNKYTETNPSDIFWELVLEDCMKADILMVNSDYVKWSFIQEGYLADRIKVVQLGVNSEFKNSKQEYNASDKIKLIFTGGFIERKGALILLDAIKILEDQKINFSLDVAGSLGSIKIPDWVKESKNIVFHGHVSQLKLSELLIASDIYIFPTYTEGAAQSVKEAMSVGLPVITTRQSGSPIVHGENGWLVENDNAEALAGAILILSKDRKLQEKLGLEAAITIKEGHTWENFAKDVLKLYNEILLK
jgi:glycosyltransferase involved in cell wall biosynthesis